MQQMHSVRLTHELFIALLCWARGAHCEGFASARLAVGHDRNIVALDKGGGAFRDVVPDAFLIDILAEDAVEDEQFAALWGIHREAGCGVHVHHGALEALRNEAEAWIVGLERRPDSHSWPHTSVSVRVASQPRVVGCDREVVAHRL